MTRFSRITRVPVTGSTNEDMAAMLGEKRSRGLTLLADYQRHGAGRKGREWIAPPGSALLFTTALPDPLPARDLWAVPFWIALAIHAALARHAVESELQWPNDLLIGGRKAGGILCISRVAGERAWAACGVGLNVARPSDDRALHAIIPPPAFVSDARAIEREALLLAILQAAGETYDELHSPERVARAWEYAAKVPGARYRLAVDGEGPPFDASAVRLGPGGALVVENADGRREISLADARVIR